MPRIETVRLGLLWLSANVDDYGTLRFPRIGLTAAHSSGRCARALLAEARALAREGDSDE